MRRSRLLPSRLSLPALVASTLLGIVPSAARASGPVERMVQVLAHPSDPSVVVVRFGLAAEGFLYSRDGGKTFRAQCSNVMDPREDAPKLDRLGRARLVEGAVASILDGDGKVVAAAPLGALYSDDGGGCGWSVDESFGEDRAIWSLVRDPRAPKDLLATVTTKSGDVDTTAQLMRRSGGRWSVVAPLRAKGAGETTLANDLVASAQRLYATVSVNRLSGTPAYSLVLVTSTDNGATWREASTLPSGDKDNVVLLGVDPSNADRLLAVNYLDAAPDVLLVSTDQGKTFREAGTPSDTRGAAFAPDGRVFVADTGDTTGAPGGLWVAARLGEPFRKVDGSDYLDCIGFDEASGKLRVCRAHRFGLMDPETGVFEQLTRLDKIESLVECGDVDTHAACEAQLNAGPSWCCTGHYSFTPFCGSYDVTRVDNKTVYCGKSGQEYDLQSGRTPEDDLDPTGAVGGDAGRPVTRDGGTGTRRDGGTTSSGDDEGDDDDGTAAPAKKGGGGCAVEATPMTPRSLGGGLLSLGALLVVLGSRMRRRR